MPRSLIDASGNPIGFHLTPGQASDWEGAALLLEELVADTLLRDKGYDADERVLERPAAPSKTAVIPPKRSRTQVQEYDKHVDKARHLIENFFVKLKQCRAIATHCDKRAKNFFGAIYRAATVIWVN